MSKQYAKELKRLREWKNLSRQDVSDATGISVSAIQMYENGERVPRDSVKIALAEFYGSSVQDIFFKE